jgi:hypothetical protein
MPKLHLPHHRLADAAHAIAAGYPTPRPSPKATLHGPHGTAASILSGIAVAVERLRVASPDLR